MLETVAPTPPAIIPPGRQGVRRRIVLLGGFGMQPKATMTYRALPLGRELVARGHNVTLIVPPWDHPEDAGRSWDDHGVHIVNIALPSRIPTVGIVMALRKAVRDAQPDVVHVFKPKGYSGLVMPFLHGIPVVLDTDDWEGAGGWNASGRYSAAQRRLFAWQERHLPRRAAHVTVASRALETQQWGLGVPPEQVTYLPNALDRARYVGWPPRDAIDQEAMQIRRQLGLDGPTVVLYTRFVEFAPETVASFFGVLRETIPTARLLIVGGGLHDEDGHARRALAAYGEAVTFVGFVPFATVPAYIRAANVAVIPFADTLINRAKSSVKTLDLLAAGQAVVATAVGENTSVIRHNETGLLVPPSDSLALVSAVTSLLADPGRARLLGDAARERAWREQTWEMQVTIVEAIYNRAITRSVAT
ncbi:MAG: glycosyltransferase family 4 protein [Thermomicrobiales bacterium]